MYDAEIENYTINRNFDGYMHIRSAINNPDGSHPSSPATPHTYRLAAPMPSQPSQPPQPSKPPQPVQLSQPLQSPQPYNNGIYFIQSIFITLAKADLYKWGLPLKRALFTRSWNLWHLLWNAKVGCTLCQYFQSRTLFETCDEWRKLQSENIRGIN